MQKTTRTKSPAEKNGDVPLLTTLYYATGSGIQPMISCGDWPLNQDFAVPAKTSLK